MKQVSLVSWIILVALISACAPVKPWQKGNLAKKHMAFDTDPTESRFMQHVYTSKEGATGGYGVAAGGCGCN